MKKLYTTIFTTIILSALTIAQSNVIIFSDDGENFYASINGKTYNDEPQARVECTGLIGENHRIDVRFEDEALANIKKNIMIEAGMQYTVIIKKNKKGAYVLRPMDMGVPVVQAEQTPEPDMSKFEQSETVQVRKETGTSNEVQSMGTTVIVTETSTTTTDGENVGMDVNMGGVGINMNVNVNEGLGGSTQTTTTTTTTSNTTSEGVWVTDDLEVVETGYVLPGYSGAVGCPTPMADSEFKEAKSSIASKSFSDSKMTLAKQIGNSKCFLTDHVKGIMSEFEFEDDKLEFAKFAYDSTYDIDNYYKVNDGFTFESSIDDLNEFIQGR